MKIIVKQKSRNEFVAWIAGQFIRQENADTPSGAVGKLVTNYSESFGIEIDYRWEPSLQRAVDQSDYEPTDQENIPDRLTHW